MPMPPPTNDIVFVDDALPGPTLDYIPGIYAEHAGANVQLFLILMALPPITQSRCGILWHPRKDSCMKC